MEHFSLLELQKLTHGFSSSKKILSDVSVRLVPQQIYTLMGANGSGKTTLFNIVGGYIKPESGKIFFGGREISSLRPNQINHLGIGRTFQEPRLIKQLTVKENVILAIPQNQTDIWYKALMPQFIFNHYINTLQERAELILESYFLKDVKDEYADSISYGQQKMLNLACAVANEAVLLLLDEPVAGISSHYQSKLVDLLMKLKNQGKTILMIEHNTEFTEKVTDQYFLLNQGKVKDYASLSSLRLDLRKIFS